MYNRERRNTIKCNTMPCINLSEYWTILLPFTTNQLIPTAIFITICPTLATAKKAYLTVSFYAFDADFLTKAQEMASFFERRGYNPETLKLDLEKMKDLSQTKALTKNTLTKEKMSRIPLILTYHPMNNRIKRILLDNFKVITDDPATRQTFPNPPIVAYRRDKNLRTSLVHTADKQATIRAGSYPCEHSRYRTCGHISSDINFG